MPSELLSLPLNGQPERLYLDLMKRVLTRSVNPERYVTLDLPYYAPTKRIFRLLLPFIQRRLSKTSLEILRRYTPRPNAREEGADWPPEAETMVGLKRLDNVQECIVDVIRRGVPGDLIETGVWRGGCSIFMKAVLTAYGDTERNVWLADSFEGLPKPDPVNYPVDAGDEHWTLHNVLAVSLETVRDNFTKYGLLDNRVKFLKGWFKDTLPTAPIAKLALMRLDGDMYESTIQVLENLYPKLSPGGYVVVDDYALVGCKAAVDDFRTAQGILDPIQTVDWTGVYWQRSA